MLNNLKIYWLVFIFDTMEIVILFVSLVKTFLSWFFINDLYPI